MALQPFVASALGKSKRISPSSSCLVLPNHEGGIPLQIPSPAMAGCREHPSLLPAPIRCTRSPTKASGNCPATPHCRQWEGERDGSVPRGHGPSSLQPGTSSPRETNPPLLSPLPAEARQGSAALPLPSVRALCQPGRSLRLPARVSGWPGNAAKQEKPLPKSCRASGRWRFSCALAGGDVFTQLRQQRIPPGSRFAVGSHLQGTGEGHDSYITTMPCTTLCVPRWKQQSPTNAFSSW